MTTRSGISKRLWVPAVGLALVVLGASAVVSQAQEGSSSAFEVRDDGIVDVWKAVYDRYDFSQDEWNEAQSKLNTGSNPVYQKVDLQVEAAFDQLFADAAATDEAKVTQDAWVTCMGGQWKSSPEFYDHLEEMAFGKNSESADMKFIESEVDRALTCQRETSDSFNQGLERIFPEWLREHQLLFDSHATMVRGALSGPNGS